MQEAGHDDIITLRCCEFYVDFLSVFSHGHSLVILLGHLAGKVQGKFQDFTTGLKAS